MFCPLHHITPYAAALLLSLSACMSACSGTTSEPTPSEQTVRNEAVVLTTDSTEWRVCLVAEHLTYSEAMEVPLPSPWLLPNRQQAAILRTLSYPSDERFVTSDGYTFGMQSSSVSKAGSKTKYSVLGLYIRPTVIRIEF